MQTEDCTWHKLKTAHNTNWRLHITQTDDRAYVCTYVYLYICISVYVYVCIYICMHGTQYVGGRDLEVVWKVSSNWCLPHIYSYTCIYIYIYACTCVYICVYMCIYMARLADVRSLETVSNGFILNHKGETLGLLVRNNTDLHQWFLRCMHVLI